MIKELFFILLSAFAAADLHSITSDDLRNLSDPTRRDPCSPSPCGPNSQCHVINGQSEYRCSPAYTLTPPEFGPACTSSSECPRNRACINQNCKDPCPGICGLNTRCETINHSPTCICKPGFARDPFVNCSEIMAPVSRLERLSYAPSCNPSTCGPNARCTTDMHGNPVCLCLSGFIGSPPNCLPECVINGDCPSKLARSELQCRDPCPESCGIGAEFHFPLCVCPENFTGDPYVKCSSLASSSPAEPECVSDSDCPRDRVCIGSKCEDLCPRACGRNAVCNVDNHRAICTSPPGILGNIFINYFLIQVPDKTDPCNPSPCGLNSQCRRINEQTVCSCMPGYLGVPPKCQPIQSDSCKSDTDCAASMACIHKKCLDPCPGSCGARAQCHADNHHPVCSCPPGLTGDPFTDCFPFQANTSSGDPCSPSPCGPKGQCQVINGQSVCRCSPAYTGTFPRCQPECLSSSVCPRDRVCIDQKCTDPCPGTCGLNAICETINHNPTCTCKTGFTGDPFERCSEIIRPVPLTRIHSVNLCVPNPCGPNAKCSVINENASCACLSNFTGNPYDECSLSPSPPLSDQVAACDPSPCGPNSQCSSIDGRTKCSCMPGYSGAPPNCRPECVINAECPSNMICIAQKCHDSCPGTCGHGAQCHIHNHQPVCSCLSGLTGNPFIQCSPICKYYDESVKVCLILSNFIFSHNALH